MLCCDYLIIKLVLVYCWNGNLHFKWNKIVPLPFFSAELTVFHLFPAVKKRSSVLLHLLLQHVTELKMNKDQINVKCQMSVKFKTLSRNDNCKLFLDLQWKYTCKTYTLLRYLCLLKVPGHSHFARVKAVTDYHSQYRLGMKGRD